MAVRKTKAGKKARLSSFRKSISKIVGSQGVAAPLSFSAYQQAATSTDRTGSDTEDGTLVSVLGVSGEAGDLVTLFKKRLRDGEAYTIYPEQCAEELGDILWYMSTLCTKLGLSLEDVARKNLGKTRARFGDTAAELPVGFYDNKFPKDERIPRRFIVEFREEEGEKKRVALYRDGVKCGDPLTDNAHFEDGYRYHDVFHLAYAAVLGWSPVTRGLLNCKRRSDKGIDEVEDGGRASVIEEGIAALVFQYAEKHNLFDGVGRIDSDMLSLLKGLTAGLEVAAAPAGEWEKAILAGYKAFRILNRESGGSVTVDLEKKSLAFQKHLSPRSK